MNEQYLSDLQNPMHIAKAATRDGYGQALLELGGKEKSVWVLTADLAESMKVMDFATQYPDRFIDCGVAEQNMMGIAAGLALSGKIPFVSSYAVFSPGRNWEQLRVSVCYSRANVKIAGGHAGLLTGPDGATHQALEDIAITRVLPNLTVVVPCDAVEARKATLAMAMTNDPTYIRLSRESMPTMTTQLSPFILGKAQVWSEGSDITIIGSGPILYEVMQAKQLLENLRVSVEVINLSTIKPLDVKTIIASVKKTGCVVTAEDHQVIGGMGSAVAETLSQHFPVPMEMIGVRDMFGQSGTAKELYTHYGLTASHIVKAVVNCVKRKG